MGDYWDDPVDEGSGLLGHFVGTVTEAFWSNLAAETEGKVTGEGSDTTKLFMHVKVDDILQQDFNGTPPETMLVSLGIGGKWWPHPDDPSLVEHEDDSPDNERPIKFKNSSGYGKLLSAVAGHDDALGSYKILDGGGNVDITMKGVADYFRKHKFMDARDAKIWVGLTFEWRGLGFPYGKDKYGGSKPFPTRFIGVDAGEQTFKHPAQPEASPESGSVWREWTDAPTAKTLDALVKSSNGSHEDFVKNAMLLPAVKSNDALAAAVQDESNYNG